jgi:hypothetical protein
MTLRKAALLLLVLSLGTCNQALLVAPSGSTMFLQANPEFIAAHGDVSVISAFLLEPSGQPVADGTSVQFFTSLGRIQEQGKTNDGVARVNLVSDSRSGTAHVTATSGGDAPTTVTTLTAAPPAAGFASAMSVSGAAAVSAAQATASIDVVIGSARPFRLILTVDPPRITGGRSTSVVARVFDADGNGVANVPVFFTIEGCTPAPCSLTERFASGGQAVFTDNDGRAEDTLFTNYSRELPPKTVTVRATTSNGITATALVTIN